ncbi:MAG: repair protein RecN [Actinomycetota bacterium]|jgi:DNA repair protein RecN (Recombination protein N)
MLTELRVSNLGIIESVDLLLGPGLIALTGETGAGKTMVVEAINLLIGERADPGRVRSGADEARIEGRFVVGDEEFVVVRVVPADGRSRAYINGRLATVGELADLGSRLVDLHGQHAHQSLLAASVQRQALDEFAKTDLEPLRAARAQLAEIDAALAAIGGDSRSRLREVELLRFQVTEISGATIVDTAEDSALEAEEALLSDVVTHRQAALLAQSALSDEGGALDAIGSALASLTQRPAFSDIRERLIAVQGELTDVSSDLRSRSESSEENPERLDEIRSRRQMIRDLCRKYGENLDDVLTFLETSRARLEELESYESRVYELEQVRQMVVAEERTAASIVAATRRSAAAALGRDITAHLPDLAMPRAIVEVTVEGDDPADDVTMLMSSNPGSPLAQLSKVASGGELARTMLAIRLVLTQGPPILIFDEVDAGIGGSAANALAASLARLAETHQVLVVTHLAQVAAAATQHLVISKEVIGGPEGETTRTEVLEVIGETRIDEVARMLSGHPDSARARDHAEELLASWTSR